MNGTDIADGCLRLRFENAHAAAVEQTPESADCGKVADSPRIEDNTVIFTAAAGELGLAPSSCDWN